MKRFICFAFALLALLSASASLTVFAHPLCPFASVVYVKDEKDFIFDDYNDFKTYVLEPKEYKKQNEEYNESWHVFYKEGYLDFYKLFKVNHGVICDNNVLSFGFQADKPTPTSITRPYITIEYNPDGNDTSSDTQGKTHLTDFTEEDAATLRKGSFIVEKDGYVFRYYISEGIVEHFYFTLSNYTVSMIDLNYASTKGTEYENVYKSADEAVKFIKKFEVLIDDADTVAENDTTDSVAIISISALAMVLVAAAVVTISIKRIKK